MAKGSYFGLTGKSPFSRLVYPVPEAAGLGVHATVDLGGRCRFGPDVEWVEAGAPWDYQMDAARAASFYSEVRKYWPALPDGALVADYAGARPKLQAPGEAAADFAVQVSSCGCRTFYSSHPKQALARGWRSPSKPWRFRDHGAPAWGEQTLNVIRLLF